MRLIDADALKEHYNVPDAEGVFSYCDTIMQTIDAQPTIEAEPVRHGRWIDTPLPNSRVARCSLCGFWQRTNGDDKTGKHLIHNAVYRYCAGCGAKMDGGADNG
jgi:hypothetical protein